MMKSWTYGTEAHIVGLSGLASALAIKVAQFGDLDGPCALAETRLDEIKSIAKSIQIVAGMIDGADHEN